MHTRERSAPPTSPTRHHDKRILIVEDDEDLLVAMQTLLVDAGYGVTAAFDGEHGLQSALEMNPDLIITDVMMPRMDGWTLVKALRSRAQFTLIPVIFLTALDSQDDALNGYTLGADDYVTKPCTIAELAARVESSFRRRAQLNDALDATKASLHGSLQDLGLPAILNLLALERKTGLLAVKSPRGIRAELSLRDGKLVGANMGDAGGLRDLHVIFHVLTWRRGTFAFVPQPITLADTIQLDITHVLMEAARRQDEQRQALLPERESCYFPY